MPAGSAMYWAAVCGVLPGRLDLRAQHRPLFAITERPQRLRSRCAPEEVFMDPHRFDSLSRDLTRARSRRGALAAVFGGTLGLLGLDETTAKQKKHKKKPPPSGSPPSPPPPSPLPPPPP